MGEQRGNNAVYYDPFAVIYWLGAANRSPTDFGLYLAAAEIRRAVFKATNPDDEPPELEWSFSWGIEANGRIVVWHGGQADAP